MRKKIVQISLILALSACANNEKKMPDNVFQNIETPFIESNSNEVFFDGNQIKLEFIESIIEKENEPKETFLVQQIQHQREDIIFRAKRIPKKLYLLNNGVPQDEIEVALEEVKGEQLFYFEFEEQQKQDLMKKYFKEDLDKPVSYLSFDITKDFYLINSLGESVSANYVIYERTFHVAPFEKIILGFSNVSESEQLRLVYDDNLFGKGKTEFSFASENYIKNNTKQPS